VPQQNSTRCDTLLSAVASPGTGYGHFVSDDTINGQQAGLVIQMSEVRHQVVFSHSLNARGRSIASGETEVVSFAKHKRDNAEAIFS
jgi:hypothetical protein